MHATMMAAMITMEMPAIAPTDRELTPLASYPGVRRVPPDRELTPLVSYPGVRRVPPAREKRAECGHT